MSSVAELSETGNHVALAVVKVGEDTPKPFHQGLWDQDLSADHQEDQAAFEVVSVVASMAVEEEVGSEAVSKTVEAMEVVAEAVLATKVAAASQEVGEALEVTADLMATALPPMPRLALAAELAGHRATEEVVASAEEGMEAPDLPIATDPLVGMIHVVVAAHMMTETAATAAAEATMIAMARFVEAAAIWSR